MAKSNDKADSELEAFSSEFRKMVGGAIVNGLINPTIVLPNLRAAADYSQDSTGNYTQSGGGNHNQTGGDYNQSAIFSNPALIFEASQLEQLRSLER